MNAIQQKRTTIRGAFTKSAHNLEALLSSELSVAKFDEIEVTLEQLSVKFKQLKECDDQVLDLLQQEKCSQDIYEKEYLSCEKNETCVFCEKSHPSQSCKDSSTTKMSLEDRKNIVKNKKACFVCPKRGHRAISCKSNVRCFACRNRHFPILCPDLASNLDHNYPNNMNNTKGEETVTNTLNSHVRHSDVYLQTLIVRLYNGTKEMLVRAIFDTGTRVEKLIPGRDGQIRLAVVKTANSEFLRLVQRLFRLQMDSPVLSVADDSTSVITRSGRLVKPPVCL
ncbi:DUF1758 domain-containing protein [Trichonephila clavata]|uniref:DUF1758 domain-containing protein n=1 Tax=Trichonephila clavata TaxID=2740835 RepID=A0A8X6LCK1_TRICU|nr:DUF1758 domain-containing protein [Trichonephila clavata]